MTTDNSSTQLTPQTISYSSIQRYGYIYKNKLYGCPFSYYLYKGTEIPPSDIDSKYAKFGNIIHIILEKFYDNMVVGNIPNYNTPREYFYKVLDDLLNQYWDYSLSETQYKDAITILNQFSDHESKRYENFKLGIVKNFYPLYKELVLTNPFNIRIDKILHNHVMVDYKTTKESNIPTILSPKSIDEITPRYILQAGTYALDYQARYQIWPPMMIYHFVRNNKTLIVPITQPLIDITKTISNNVIENINNRKFPKNSQNCTYCDYRHVCGLEEVDVIF